ncbi:MAG: hypothetical protein OWS03_02800 [Alicyclobacillaceae bacterium]|nr:hypothetical protein [Alicyclobacillaceae bacterium]
MRKRKTAYWIGVLRLREGNTALASLYTELINTTIGLILFGMVVTFGALMIVRQEVLNAAVAGAQTAAVTEDTAQVEQVVEDVLDSEGLPTTYQGVTLYSVRETNISNSGSDPIATVTVEYHAPIPFPNLLVVFGQDKPMPLTLPIVVSNSFLNQSYFGG